MAEIQSLLDEIERTKRGRARNHGLIPTWQVGQEQPAPDVRSFMGDGYGKNSLIYACIKEKATSFASLQPVVERPTGQIMREHRAIQLLENPNDYQDGQTFAQLLMTQLEAAGGVYIWARPVGSTPERQREFRTFPVQELELMRPDYVTIEPGSTREADTFLVTVEGTVRARIPRREMIHIHEPDLLNDFYGMSKIARLQREGAIDLQMSDFELAFFRNAGVPMGMLSVKGISDPEEITATKKAFRAAYNGIKKWFELLVLNAETATYTPMGTKQSEMEMDATRFHVESRICSVFGVPGIIVGARYALQAGSQLPYEESEHAFWAETMVPDSLRVARSWTKFLLPKFAVQADRRARVTYDFTVVRALQEDRSRKLREVVRLVLTGGFTVNEALILCGLPTQQNGDFYVRNGNQVIVSVDGTITPMMPPASEGEESPNLDNPLEGAASLHRGAARLNGHRAVEEALTIFRGNGLH